MTDDTAIRVRALDRELRFEDRDALADHVREILDNRGGIYDPMELAAIRKHAELGNGGAPDRVHRIARQTAFHTSEGGRAERERAKSPFGERIAELDAERQEKAAELDDARAALSETRRQIRALDRRKARGEMSRAERRKVEDEIRQLRHQLHAQNDAVQDARKAAIRAKGAWNKCRLAADRWRADQEARYRIDGETVTREELERRLDRR